MPIPRPEDLVLRLSVLLLVAAAAAAQAESLERTTDANALAATRIWDGNALARAGWGYEVVTNRPAVLLLQDHGGNGEWIASLEVGDQLLSGLLEEGERLRGEIDLSRRLQILARSFWL